MKPYTRLGVFRFVNRDSGFFIRVPPFDFFDRSLKKIKNVFIEFEEIYLFFLKFNKTKFFKFFFNNRN